MSPTMTEAMGHIVRLRALYKRLTDGERLQVTRLVNDWLCTRCGRIVGPEACAPCAREDFEQEAHEEGDGA